MADRTFSYKYHRQQWQELANSYHTQFLFLYCECPKGVAVERIQQRSKNEQFGSEDRADFYHQQRHAYDFDFTDLEYLEIETTKPLDEQVASALASLSTSKIRI